MAAARRGEALPGGDESGPGLLRGPRSRSMPSSFHSTARCSPKGSVRRNSSRGRGTFPRRSTSPHRLHVRFARQHPGPSGPVRRRSRRTRATPRMVPKPLTLPTASCRRCGRTPSGVLCAADPDHPARREGDHDLRAFRSLVEDFRRLEPRAYRYAAKILAATLFVGYASTDSADPGMSVMITPDRSRPAAQAAAAHLPARSGTHAASSPMAAKRPSWPTASSGPSLRRNRPSF